MADMLTTDPFFSLLANVQDVKTKVADSVFENYKLQVAQANDINNRAMQVALHDATALADLKGAVSKGTLEAMLATARTDAAIGATASATQRTIYEQSEFTRNLINGLNTQNLNTALINTNTALNWPQWSVRWSRSCLWRCCVSLSKRQPNQCHQRCWQCYFGSTFC